MHIPQGFWKDGMGDIDVIAHDGVFHAFYLAIPSHDRVGHLTSRDGLNWKEEPAALHTGAPGAFDDDQIWTMGVFEHEGRFFMLYTGLAMKERGKAQRVGLATSDDLFTWTRHGTGPVAEADGRWYHATTGSKSRIDWRDPWVYSEDGVLHGLVTARTNQGPENRRGCVGYMVSTDGYKWEVKPPLTVPGALYDFETLAIAKVRGRYYLTGIAGKDNAGAPVSIYRVADRVTGPYRRMGHGELLPVNNQVFKPVTVGGRTLYFSHMRGVADWEGGGGRNVTALAPAKVADTDPDGALFLRTFDGWSAVADGTPETFEGAGVGSLGSGAEGTWSAGEAGLRGRAPVGVGAFLLDREQGSLLLKARIRRLDAPEFGVILRARGSDDATYVSLTPSLGRVQLYVLQPFHKTPCAGVTYRWRGRRVVQEWSSDRPWGETVEVHVAAYGPYVEVSVDGRVLISAITMVRPEGQVGFFVEDGEIEVERLEILPLRAPSCLDGCA